MGELQLAFYGCDDLIHGTGAEAHIGEDNGLPPLPGCCVVNSIMFMLQLFVRLKVLRSLFLLSSRLFVMLILELSIP